jgi:CheY-like chemotaxis protein/two-component sensor histidine kinase
MLGLVNDILDYNKIEAGQLDLYLAPTNLQKLLQQATLPFCNRFEERQIELKVVIDERLNETVLADDLRLIQILNNLLANALKYTEHGYVKLEIELKERKGNALTVRFSVEDTGIGIKLADQPKIFGSFWQVPDEATRKYGGTGLGLTICERLLLLMNSSMQVESKVGVGSIFSFTVEFPIMVPNKKEVKLVDGNTDLTGIRILLAEDNLINMMIARKMLEDWNATLTTAEDGEVALKHLAESSAFDLILLDLEMPNVNGYTAIKEIKKLYPHLPVLAFTAALMDNEMMQNLLNIGFLDCVLKPFQPLEFFAKIRKYSSPREQSLAVETGIPSKPTSAITN